MPIRKAENKDIPVLLYIKMRAIERMYDQGNKLQYDFDIDSYPNHETFIEDIEEGYLYLIEENHNIEGFYFLEIKDEKPFINQNFINTSTVHRLFVSIGSQGKGIATKLFNHSIELSKRLNKDYLMVDTHPLNIPMNKLIKKIGFTQIEDISWVEPMNEINIRKAYYLDLKKSRFF